MAEHELVEKSLQLFGIRLYFSGFLPSAASGRTQSIACGWQAMPMLEQATTPPSRWQMMQRSVHTAQPGMPDCVEVPTPPGGRGAGESSSGVAGGVGGGSAARAAAAVSATAKPAIMRIDR
jgi:hypothetical protein